MGPVSSILLDRKINLEEIQIIDEFLHSIVIGKFETSEFTRNFWIDSKKLFNLNTLTSDCQFSISFDNVLSELDEEEIIIIKRLTNKDVKAQIFISAGCNQPTDHNLLGQLTLELTKLLNGLVDFGGNLKGYYNEIGNLNGELYSIITNLGICEYQISNSEFLANWMKHPNFKMIK